LIHFYKRVMFSPSPTDHDDSPVIVTPIRVDSSLTPGMLVIVVILSIVGLLFVILVLWYTLDCVGMRRHKNKMEEDTESLDRSIEVLREVGVEESILTVKDPACLVVPRLNPGCTPSIFKGGLQELDYVETGKVKATVHASDITDDQKNYSGEKLEGVPVDLDMSVKEVQMMQILDKSTIDSGAENAHFLQVKENILGNSNTSLNTVFLDCREDSPPVSFRSAINSFRARMSIASSVISTTTLSNYKPSPVCRIEFTATNTPTMLHPSKKEPLCDEDTPSISKLPLDQTIRFGTEF